MQQWRKIDAAIEKLDSNLKMSDEDREKAIKIWESKRTELNTELSKKLLFLMVVGVKDVETNEDYVVDDNYWEKEADEDDWILGMDLLMGLGDRIKDRMEGVKKKHPSLSEHLDSPVQGQT